LTNAAACAGIFPPLHRPWHRCLPQPSATGHVHARTFQPRRFPPHIPRHGSDAWAEHDLRYIAIHLTGRTHAVAVFKRWRRCNCTIGCM